MKFSSIAALAGGGVFLVVVLGSTVLKQPTGDGLLTILVLSLLSAIQIAFLATQRAEFTGDRFVFRRWGGAFEVRYVDIRTIEWLSASRTHFSAKITTTDDRRLVFALRLFPDEVAARLAKIYADFSSSRQ